jgi:hypothetical protein
MVQDWSRMVPEPDISHIKLHITAHCQPLEYLIYLLPLTARPYLYLTEAVFPRAAILQFAISPVLSSAT